MLAETLLRRRVLFVAIAALTINVLGVTAASAERGASSRVTSGAASKSVVAPADPATTSAAATQPSPAPTPAPVTTAEVTAPPATEAPSPPSTLALEAPAPTEPPVPAPAPAPAAPAPAAEPQPSDPLARAQQAMQESAPGNWLAAVPHRIKIIDGTTSYGSTDGTIYVSRYHAGGDWDHLRSVLAHEFGHLIAYGYGSQAYLGAPPAGWPDPGYGRPEEEWADCVEYAFTAIPDPAYGMPVCSGSTLSWTQDWLATHP